MDAEDSFESSSDEDYNENEKRLLNKYRNKKKNESDSENEVFGVGASDSEEDQSDIALSDVEGQEERDNLPDARAWGKERKKFYGADYVDQDYGGFQGKDAESADIEEQEAKQLQSQLIKQLDDDDFAFDLVFKKSEKEKLEDDQTEETIKTDISGLSTKEKLQLLQKESPEMFALIADFETKISLVKDYLQPVLEKHKNGKIPNSTAVEFVQTQHDLIMSYLCNIYMYLLVKNNKQLKNHPVIKKLYQYRQMLSQIEPIFEEIIKPQIEIILLDKEEEMAVETTENVSKKNKKKKMLKLLQNVNQSNNSKKSKKENKITTTQGGPATKKLKLDKKSKENKKQVTFAEEVEADENENGEEDEMEHKEIDEQEPDKEGDQQESEKRAITYQIAKNKGLTPHRKKVNRNPRVKHKLKFRKAIIRRKGAVREPRKELSRYSGEISGIKAYVSKSIKLKS